jgi:chlorite dismutase
MTETVAAKPRRRPEVGPVRVGDATKSAPRQLVRFAFYGVMPEWRRLHPEIRASPRQELAGVLRAHVSKLHVRTYTLVGTRGDAALMVWVISEDAERLQELLAAINGTALEGCLTCSHRYTSMTKRSIYVDTENPNQSDGRDRLVLAPGSRRFLFVYPFVKTRARWALPPEGRQRMMEEQIRIGHQFPGVKIKTTYSFGLDGQEFVVAFATDSAADFLDCVQALRNTESSSYTARGVPSFTCIQTEAAEMLEALG